VNKINIHTSFFGVIFFGATWIFLGTFVIGAFIAVLKRKSANVEQRDDDSDSDGEN